MKRFDTRDPEEGLHSSWMLSFGDLLTLLLCFFLCALSFSPLNPHRGNEAISKQNQQLADSTASTSVVPVALERAGTALAKLNPEASEFGTLTKPNDSSELVVNLSESDFIRDAWEPVPNAIDKVKSQVRETSYAVLGVKLESCFPEQARAEEAAWAGSMSRILSMRGQLIDAGLPAALMRYRPLGPHCEALEGQEARPERTVMRITIERGLSHG